MKILFKSKETTLIEAAIKWRDSLNMNREISYAELKPYIKGETPEYNFVTSPTGRAICFVRLTKENSTYTVFKHDQFGIVLAREE